MADPGSADLTAAIEQFRATMTKSLDSLVGTLHQVEQAIGELAGRQREQEQWLTSLSQRLTAERLSSDQLTGGEYLQHVEIGGRYRRLITQRLLDLALAADPSDAGAEARYRASLARALFAPESITAGPVRALESLGQTGVAVPADRFQSVWNEAEEIRHDAEATGHRCQWRFDAELGAPPDLARHEVCEGCAPGDPVALIIAPAYVVDDKVQVKQLVLTGPAAPASCPGPGESPRE